MRCGPTRGLRTTGILLLAGQADRRRLHGSLGLGQSACHGELGSHVSGDGVLTRPANGGIHGIRHTRVPM